ncbi:MAG: LCP family protein [Candidatus Caldatribacterium sp.]|uniref:LCP family protein n=1 Tax=Candidatus Caldatribacterium sp. TaxID=2282143 RepID=UPI002996226B|nr:LCP family protein [Candidatus Caldatribacterium sp.]MCX7731320.1 LCP family protein [Candidatus Caldatribacterium sp.]MDW8080704.1 LCP family protein [Candidatus Calescibacterium sp.]
MKRGWKVFYLILGFLIGFAILFALLLFGFETPFRWTVVKRVMGYAIPENTCILVVGQDSIKPLRSDTIILVFINTESREILLFSVPRDSRMLIPGVGYDKANHAYARGGIELLKATLEDNLHIEIPYFVEVNYEAFERVVDALGGVEIEVEKPMYYVDRAQGLTINLKPGRRVLNGKEALQYVRFRHDPLGDIGRIKRQQVFLQALLAKVQDPSVLAHLPSLLESLKTALHTNIPLEKILQLALWFKGLEEKQVSMDILPGEPVYLNGLSFWGPQLEVARERIQGFFAKGRETHEDSGSHSQSQRGY